MSFKLNHVHLVCLDLEKMISFFVDTLGADLVARKKFGGADGASLDLAGTTINLRVKKSPDEKPNGSGAGCWMDHLAIQTEDMEKAMGEISAKGFEFDGAPREVGPVKVVFFTGPEGLSFELMQPLG